ncbi:LysR substrate-binding domain-containing protein [Ahrensia marina]|uniref:LysR substrate-binding domain-containing protein n=1 Tax=Ahrensia marina TaxID=1514904 RepID=UPI0006B5AA3C|nr:LysR substrate-binding domain-containing protein [Ahrensia marina]
MHEIRRKIPNLGALITFEAAMRLMSFTAASQELGVTQAAVSRRIKELESELGTTLFIRANRSVKSTPAGQILMGAVDASFSKINDAVKSIKELEETDIVTIGVSFAFAHFRLLPSLSTFHNLHPNINIRVVSQDSWTSDLDEDLDLVLRYSEGTMKGRTIIGALPDDVFPVCSPDFARQLGISSTDDIDMRQLAQLPLIEGEKNAPSWLNWSQWFARMGEPSLKIRPRLEFSNYSDAAYAAMNNDGVALGWKSLLQRPLTDGRLIALGKARLQPDGQHQLAIKDDKVGKEPFATFANWLTSAMAT